MIIGRDGAACEGWQPRTGRRDRENGRDSDIRRDGAGEGGGIKAKDGGSRDAKEKKRGGEVGTYEVEAQCVILSVLCIKPLSLRVCRLKLSWFSVLLFSNDQQTHFCIQAQPSFTSIHPLAGPGRVVNQQSEDMSSKWGHFGRSSLFLATVSINFRVKFRGEVWI